MGEEGKKTGIVLYANIFGLGMDSCTVHMIQCKEG